MSLPVATAFRLLTHSEETTRSHKTLRHVLTAFLNILVINIYIQLPHCLQTFFRPNLPTILPGGLVSLKAGIRNTLFVTITGSL